MDSIWRNNHISPSCLLNLVLFDPEDLAKFLFVKLDHVIDRIDNFHPNIHFLWFLNLRDQISLVLYLRWLPSQPASTTLGFILHLFHLVLCEHTQGSIHARFFNRILRLVIALQSLLRRGWPITSTLGMQKLHLSTYWLLFCTNLHASGRLNSKIWRSTLSQLSFVRQPVWNLWLLKPVVSSEQAEPLVALVLGHESELTVGFSSRGV